MTEENWLLLPCYRINERGKCSCGRACSSAGKHPQTRNGLRDATRDTATIRDWIRKDPYCQMAVRTGIESGIWVLDLDTKKPFSPFIEDQKI